MEIVDGNFVFGGIEAVVVGRAVMISGFGAATGHPHREAVGIVITTVVATTHLAIEELATWSAAKFAAAEDKGVVQKTPGFEVAQERGNGLVDGMGIPTVSFFQIGVLIPKVPVA